MLWHTRAVLPVGQTLARGTVLLVDDDPAACDIYGQYFERAGYLVVTVMRGADVLMRALQCAPDIIVMDLMLPGMSGCGATRQLKANPRTASIPVVGITASLSGDLRREAIAAGCADVILKPFPPEQLVLSVRDFLRTNQV